MSDLRNEMSRSDTLAAAEKSKNSAVDRHCIYLYQSCTRIRLDAVGVFANGFENTNDCYLRE